MAATLLSGFSAHAGTLICSGPSVYYVEKAIDGGARPPPGAIIGSTLIVLAGKVVVKKNNVSGLGKFSPNAYDVELDSNSTELERTGNMLSGSRIYKTTAAIYKNDTVNPTQRKIVALEQVVCSQTHAMMP